MAVDYGRTTLGKTGRDVRVIADGNYSGVKSGGITLDMTTVPVATGAPVTLADDTVVPVGAAYMRFGQVVARITASGKFGPYDPAAADGRQTLVRGECFVLDRTWVDQPAVGAIGLGSLHPCVFDSGRVRKDRIIQSGVGAHSLAAGPTLAELNAAFPGLSYVES